MLALIFFEALVKLLEDFDTVFVASAVSARASPESLFHDVSGGVLIRPFKQQCLGILSEETVDATHICIDPTKIRHSAVQRLTEI